MKQKKSLLIGITALIVILTISGIYFGLAWYYSERFCYGTWINGVYCTGKSVEEVNEELLSQVTYDKITVIDRNNNCFEVNVADIDYKMDYTTALDKIKEEQAWLNWIQYYFKTQNFEIMPDVVFSEEKLNTLLMEADFMNTEVYSENNIAEIILTDEGYCLMDHTINQIVPEQVCIAVADSLYEMQDEVNIADIEGCYLSMEQNAKTKAVYSLWDEISDFQDFNLTYVLGNRKEYVDASVVAQWITVDEETGEFVRDEEGKFVLNEAKVMEYVVALGEKYDTYGKEREFMSTRGDLITIEKSVYGNDIDEEDECALLIEDFCENRDGIVREPVYAQKAISQNEDDIGDTYIEVDMTEQMLYYYVDGEIVLETAVVTGNMRRGWDTPAVVCSVYGKAKNRILRGATYATFVYYWMPVYGNIGLHDATWRKEFGDDIYMTDGSHGCINMPKDKAGELYGMLEIDTPVILFY